MKLDIEITPEAYNALEEPLKAAYVQGKEGKYELEGVAGMVRGFQTDLNKFEKFKGMNADEAKEAVEILKSLGVKVDAETLKKALDTQQKAEQKKLIDKGEYDKALALETQGLRDELTTARTELDGYKGGFLGRELDLKLIEAGVMPDRVRYARGEIAGNAESVLENGELSVRLKSGVGDLATAIEGLKTSAPFLFAASTASGSGASGSSGNGGGSDFSKMTADQKIHAGISAALK